MQIPAKNILDSIISIRATKVFVRNSRIYDREKMKMNGELCMGGLNGSISLVLINATSLKQTLFTLRKKNWHSEGFIDLSASVVCDP